MLFTLPTKYKHKVPQTVTRYSNDTDKSCKLPPDDELVHINTSCDESVGEVNEIGSNTTYNVNKMIINDDNLITSTCYKNLDSVKKTVIHHEPNCVICMEVFSDDDDLYMLPCWHYFHTNCTQGWLKVRIY